MMDYSAESPIDGVLSTDLKTLNELAAIVHAHRNQKIELLNVYCISSGDVSSDKFFMIDIGKGVERCVPYVAAVVSDGQADGLDDEERIFAESLYSKGFRMHRKDSACEERLNQLLEKTSAELDSDDLLIYWLPWKDMMCRLTLGVNGFMRLESDGNVMMLPSKLMLNMQ